MDSNSIAWFDMVDVEVHDSDDLLKAELEQAEQDLASQAKRVSELTTELGMKTKEKQKWFNAAGEAHLDVMVSELTTMLDMETEKNKSLSEQVEQLSAELQTERNWSLETIDQMEKQHHYHQQELLEAKQCNAVQVAHLHEFVGLQKSNFDLNYKLQYEKNLNRALQREAARLSTDLETEIKKNNDLSRLGESVQAKLQKEWTWKLELIDHLQALKEANVETEDPESNQP
ncbi:putative leucine-rich repeat-containing protein DDB G0290503 [Scophthalmus maximus]|uniref:Putative leucine-rich repeat-containing protein DDB G0290503 n=1 Tax=Scophthalmus maximus TaxID=52904 RepID=A0A2U9CHA6_SCOMX|nr:putative leucine-rich repeat-containing protein DDB G0290503 [Scophthalmus maximus]KAF0021645.1 hypothetical protein F2P81_026102 [Scophthalmus maximus]KAF0032029.1 hypothetical protein F2P81_016584 [Scophthalmus maximus]